MKQMIVSVTVRGDDDRDVIMHLDVPDSEIDGLIETITQQAEAYETEDLGPLDDEDFDFDDEEEAEELDFDEDDDY